MDQVNLYFNGTLFLSKQATSFASQYNGYNVSFFFYQIVLCHGRQIYISKFPRILKFLYSIFRNFPMTSNFVTLILSLNALFIILLCCFVLLRTVMNKFKAFVFILLFTCSNAYYLYLWSCMLQHVFVLYFCEVMLSFYRYFYISI